MLCPSSKSSKGRAATALGKNNSKNQLSKSSVLIQPLSLVPYFVPGTSCLVQAALMCFASYIINGGNTCPAALPHATIVICPFLPGDWYHAFFVPFTVTTSGALGSNGMPDSSTLYSCEGASSKLCSFNVSSSKLK